MQRHGVMCDFRSNMIDMITDFMKYYTFAPLHMTRVRMSNIVPKKVKYYDPPKIMVDVPMYFLIVDGFMSKRYKMIEKPLMKPVPGTPIAFGAVRGVPFAHVTGVGDSGYPKNLEKMAQNRLEPDPEITPELMYNGILRLLKAIDYDPDAKLGFSLPDKDLVIDLIKEYKTAVGQSPYSYYSVFNPNDGTVVNRVVPKYKSDICEEIAEYILQFLNELDNLSDGRMLNKVSR
jgi:hypothetical protein